MRTILWFWLIGFCPATAQVSDTLYSDAGGFTINLLKKGNHVGYTIILENGLCGNAANWNGLNDSLAKSNTVITYSRAFLGKSGKGDPNRNANVAVIELKAALDNAQIPGPYILAGYSLGGHFVKAFARKYPAHVKGILLIDPLNTAEFYQEYKTKFAKLYQFDAFPLKQVPTDHPCYHEIQSVLSQVSFDEGGLPRDIPTQMLVSSVPMEIDLSEDSVKEMNLSAEDGRMLKEDNIRLQQRWVSHQLKWAAHHPNVEVHVTDQCTHQMHHARIDLVLAAFSRLQSRLSQ